MPQLVMGLDGTIKDRVQIAIERLRAFEPPDGYYVAFSGGKDSQCVYHLCKMAGVKFDAHYNVTSVDPPELVRFIKSNYPDVKFERRHDKDGKPVTMWGLIPQRLIPPTRKVRYCCEELKESNGKGRITVTGVRWAESTNRASNHGVITIPKLGKKIKKEANDFEFRQTKSGGVVLNYDDDEGRRITEFCIRTGKALVNPIIDWGESDVWGFLEEIGVEYCSLYDEGFKRLGCIGCPMGRKRKQTIEFERWPKYKQLYLKAFSKMLEERRRRRLPNGEWGDTPESVFDWWIGSD